MSQFYLKRVQPSSEPPSLRALSQRACIRNLPLIQDVADLSYDVVRPILRKIENPEQLHNIEIASPHIADHDAELWKAFIKRDIPNWEENLIEPKNPRSWWKVYRMMLKQEQRAKEEQEKQLKEAMLGIDKQKESNQAQYVGRVIPQPRRGKAYLDGVRNPHANEFGALKTPTLRNAKRGQDIMSAIRRQSSQAQKLKTAAEKQVRAQMLPQKRVSPNAISESAKAQIKVAPQTMVRAYTKPAPLSPSPPAAKSATLVRRSPPSIAFVKSKSQVATNRAIDNAIKAEQAVKEERLRALASGKRASSSPTKQEPKGTTSIPAKTVVPSRTKSSTTTPVVGAKQPQPAPASNSNSSAPAAPAASASPASPSTPGSPTTAGVKRKASPTQGRPPMRKRPAPSLFIVPPHRRYK
jgi:elongin-A